MEVMALSPTMTSKLKSRDYANKIRHGSPKLQEVLREVRNLYFQNFQATLRIYCR